jgi:hypothetical protein
MTASPKAYLQSALKKIVPDLNNLWTETAKGYDWDKQIHQQVKISSDLRFDHPDHLEETINDTEYGFKAAAPKAAMRSFAAAATPNIDGAICTALGSMLKDSGVTK